MTRARILIVEARNTIAMDLRNRLTGLGYEVAAVVADGEEALNKTSELKPDLALVDIMLKGETAGIRAAQQIRDRFDLPVIYLAARSDERTLQQAGVTEPNSYILEPFADRELQLVIEAALNARRARTKSWEDVRLLAAALRTVAEGVIATNGQGRVQYMNPVAEALTGWMESEAAGLALSDVFIPLDSETRTVLESPAGKVLRKVSAVDLVSHALLVARDGKETVIDFSVTPVQDEHGETTGVVLIFRDITERRLLEAALRESEERYLLAVRGANDGLWDWNLRTNEIRFSPRWKAMLGYEENEIGDRPDEWFNRVHTDDLSRVRANLTAHLQGRSPIFECEYRIRHKDGSYLWMLSRGVAVWDEQGRAYRTAGSQTDITLRKSTEERLMHEAVHDTLTGLPNRVLFMDRLGQVLEHMKRHPDRVAAVLLMDLDRFKIVNDSLGHVAGDLLLVNTARRLQASLRPEDTVARLGGDEFAILLDDVQGAVDAVQVADRIQRRLLATFTLSEQGTSATASIGIVILTSSYEGPEDIMRDADTAMYRAKALGRARYQIFDADMHNSAVTLMRLEADLKRAITRQELQVYYQPIISTISGRITGAEALVRWEHPDRGILPPSEFMAVAEETGLIVPVGERVLHLACTQTKSWHDSGYRHFWISVNISARQLQDQSMIRAVKAVLEETGLPAQALKLEVTESVAMKDIDLSTRTLRELNGMGIHLSIDDFGNGYSSLSYLKRFPLRTLKIDQSFVRDISRDPDIEAITGAIIAMAHSLKLAVIAEGVETENQLTLLSSQKCDELQGFLFSRPVPASELTRMLQVGHIPFVRGST